MRRWVQECVRIVLLSAMRALIFHNNIQMLPYKPIISITKPHIERIKPIPSIQLINMLQNLCQNSSNHYDRKNHILTINDFYFFQQMLNHRYQRSFKSFDKQLRLLGFKSRRMNNIESEEDLTCVRVFKWRGKKEELVNRELEFIQDNLKNRRKAIQDTRASVKEKREKIDEQIERIIFSLMVDRHSTQAGEKIKQAIQNTRKKVNETQKNMIRIVNEISSTMGNQLQLYRLLIYKQGDQYKANQSEQQQNGEYEERQEESEESQKSAALSIKVEDGQEQPQQQYSS